MSAAAWPTTGIGGLAGNAPAAALAEELGYESVWISEVNGPDAVTTMCEIASRTKTITIATGVMCIYLRDPLLMAMTANSLVGFAGPRLILGLGTSTQVVVERWHGLKWDHPVGTTGDYVRLVRQLLAGERVKEDGLYRLSGAQLTVPPNGEVPIFLGALNKKMLRLAGAIGDGVILNFPTLSYTRWAIDCLRQGIAETGRQASDVNVTAFLRTTVTDDPASAIPAYRAELLTYVLSPVYRRVFTRDGYGEVCDAVNEKWAAGDRAGAMAAVSDEMVRDHSVIGTEAECRKSFDAFRNAGVHNAVVFAMPGGAKDANQSVMNSVRVLAGA
jgi:probable F420-dependent oxidoreductase